MEIRFVLGGNDMDKIMFKINNVTCRLCLLFMFGIAEARILSHNQTLFFVLGLSIVNMCIIHIIVQIIKKISKSLIN